MAMRLMSWVKTKIVTMKNVKVMLGVSGKDDSSRFSEFTSDRFKKMHPDIEILPVDDTKMNAVKSSSGKDISATDIRNNIDDNDFLKTILPNKLSNE
jgi:NH3-dependent NAD+ synthetase